MQFEDRLECSIPMVNTTLEIILSDISSTTPDCLLAAMRHGILTGGKRLRPFLLIASAEIFGISAMQSVRTAAALECVHCYSLIHDDLPSMDNSTLRRGKPSVHIVFGEALAILAGDALLSLSFEIIASDHAHLSPDVRARLILLLARASGASAMAGGQVLDMESLTVKPDEAGILRLQTMKTGSLLRFAVEAGGLIGRADETAMVALGAYGDAIGVAFQIADDLLDVEGTVKTVGKDVAKDAQIGKTTLIDLLGVDASRCRLADLVDEAIAHLAIFGHAGEPLRDVARFIMTRIK